MEQRLQHLVRRLAFIGYRPHEINHIVKSSTSDKTALVGQLEALVCPCCFYSSVVHSERAETKRTI